MKLYKELRLQGNHCLYTFIESEVRNDKVHEVEKHVQSLLIFLLQNF